MNDNGNPFAQDFYGQTTLAPLGLVAILVLGLAMILVPRKYAVWPMLTMACFVPPAQRVVIFTLNFDLLRIMVLFGSVRVFLRGEWRGFRWSRLDYLMVIWSVYGLFATFANFMALDAIKYDLGAIYDALGMYFLFRCVVRDWLDVDEICRAMALLSLPVLAFFLIEHSTGHNLFAALGGVPAITDLREGRLRCQGAFAHPILAGCFWASAMPLLITQWWRRRIPRWLTVSGLISSGAIVMLCSSSTPVSALILGAAALGLFYWRRYLRSILAVVVLALIGLQLAMNHPIWWLLSYVDIVGGSTGWFRYNVMQQAADHIGEWWLIGSAQGTAHWGFFDITNLYVVEGLHGGLGLLALFVGIISVGFALVARAVRSTGNNETRALLAWAIGVGLFMHAANYLAVCYFGQILVIWYLQLAMIGSLGTLYAPAQRRTRSRRPWGAGSPRQLAPPPIHAAPALPAGAGE